MSFRTGRHFWYIPHTRLLHPSALTRLDFLYPYIPCIYTGCDTYGIILWCKGEEVSMGNLEVFEYAAPTFLALSSGQADVTDNDAAVLERFTIAVLTVRGTLPK